jgi:mycothiol synthase
VRGLGLGRAVCTGVVRYLVDRGYANVVLYTDDWRLPAIGLYLSMGFEPQMTRMDMPERWRRVQEQLEVGGWRS